MTLYINLVRFGKNIVAPLSLLHIFVHLGSNLGFAHVQFFISLFQRFKMVSTGNKFNMKYEIFFSFDHNYEVRAVFLDISKVFDKV